MKIAFVSDDHQTISAHFGRALYYEIFTIDDGKTLQHDTSPKVHHGGSHEEHHASMHQHDHGSMLAPIQDCQVLIAGGMGWGAHQALETQGIQPIITSQADIQAALQAFLAGKLDDHPEKLH